jgi:hypothetical protein
MNTKFNEVLNILWNLYDSAIEADAFEGIANAVRCWLTLAHVTAI